MHVHQCFIGAVQLPHAVFHQLKVLLSLVRLVRRNGSRFTLFLGC